MSRKTVILLELFACLFITTAVVADDANVKNVEIINEGDNRFTFEVTVQHNDTGWDHYADRWEILNPEGKIIAIRVLRHPHVKEQPFTRRLHFVVVDEEIDEVTVRAHCPVNEFGGEQLTVKIPR